MAFPRTVSGLARRIADDIEKNGHFQSGRDSFGALFDWQAGGKCCIIANPTMSSVWNTGKGFPTHTQYRLTTEFEDALRAKVGSSITGWSDATPTAEVVRTLRSM